MVLVLSFIDVMNHVTCFVDIEPALHPKYKSHLVVVNYFFNVLLDAVGSYLVEDFCIHGHQGNWSIVLPFSGVSVWFWNQCNAGFIKRVWKFSFHFLFFGTVSGE